MTNRDAMGPGGRPLGRPSDFNQEIADEICALLIEGRSLAEICRTDGMPKYRTVFGWLQKDQEFALDYARAREAQAAADADTRGDITARGISGEIDPASARVAIDALKWTAGKRKPKVYGDKLDLSSNDGSMSPKPVLDVSRLSTAALIELQGAMNDQAPDADEI